MTTHNSTLVYSIKIIIYLDKYPMPNPFQDPPNIVQSWAQVVITPTAS